MTPRQQPGMWTHLLVLLGTVFVSTTVRAQGKVTGGWAPEAKQIGIRCIIRTIILTVASHQG